jgi:hypothetical protein
MRLSPVFLLLTIPVLRAASCAAAPPGLTGWLHFDEQMFREPGEHSPQRIPGQVGSALRFDGRGQYFELPASTKGWDPGSGDFSLELWVRTTDATSTANIVDKRSYDPWGYLIFLWNGELHFQVPTPARHEKTTDKVAGPAPHYKIADGKWHHVAGVVRRLPPQNFFVYVDGIVRGQSSDGVTVHNITVPAPLWLGRHHANKLVQTNETYFAGDIDEVSFYNRALTPTEIQSIYRAGSAGKCVGRDGK